jgi:hypothetical protein
MDNLYQAQKWQRLAKMDLYSAEFLLNMHPLKQKMDLGMQN